MLNMIRDINPKLKRNDFDTFRKYEIINWKINI